MKKKEIVDLVSEKVYSVLEKDGFEYRKIQSQFSKKANNNLIFRINFVYLNFAPTYKIHIYVAIRDENVENIKNLFLDLVPKSRKETSTLTLPISFFTDKKCVSNTIDFYIKDESDIDKMFFFFISFYREYIAPFFEEYSTLTRISEFMKDSIDKNIIYSDRFYVYLTSAIALKLDKDPKYRDRIEEYRELIKDYPTFNKDKFEKLIDHLQTL